MSEMISEDELHAFADGQLSPQRRTQVEAWLAAHPEHRVRVDDWRAQQALLHRAFDRVLDEPVPTRLVDTRSTVRSWRPDLRIAAAITWVTLGVLIGYAGHAAFSPPATGTLASLPKMAALAHVVYVPEARHPVEVGVDQEAHLVAWLSKRLGSPLRPPSLALAGYALIGGRLLPGAEGEVAQFMYQNTAGTRLTLYVQPRTANAEAASFRYAREGKVDVFYWVDGAFGYALSGNTGRDDMLRLAHQVHEQLTPEARAEAPSGK